MTSTVYTIKGGYISKITAGTPVNTLLDGLNEREFIKVFHGSTEVAGSTKLVTGMVVKLLDDNTVKQSLTAIVTGDTDGDGNLTTTDMAAVKAHLLSTDSLNGASALAADINGDATVSITDFIRFNAHILGKQLQGQAIPASNSASATLTGPETVRAEDTITLSFLVNGSGNFGVSGTLEYDENQVSLSEIKQTIASPWTVEFHKNNIISYDNNLSTPINENTELFTVTFKVKNVETGSPINISFNNIKVSDGSSDAAIETVTYRTTVSAPISTNADLSTLTVSNAAISPAFHPEITSYTADVPNSVTKLDVTAFASDSKATVRISNPNLNLDSDTEVIITVIAENGAQKEYRILVKRTPSQNASEKIPAGNSDEKTDNKGISLWGILLIVLLSMSVLILSAGLGIGFRIMRKRAKTKIQH